MTNSLRIGPGSQLTLSNQHSYFSPAQLGTSSRSTDQDNFEKLTSAYKACLDEATIRQLGITPLAEMVKQIKTAFPLSAGEPRGASKALSETILLLAQYGISGLVASGTGADDADPDVVVVSVSPPWSIGLPSKERYADDALVKKYQGVMVEVLSQLSPEINKDALAAVVDFEKKLAAASPSTEERQDVTVWSHPHPRR